MSENTQPVLKALVLDRPSRAEAVFFALVLSGLVAFHVFSSLATLVAICVGLMTVTLCFKVANSWMPQVLVLLVAYLTLFLLTPFPYLNSWPLDLYIMAGVGWFVLRRFKDIDLSARWSLKFSKKECWSFFLIAMPSLIVLSVYFKFFPEIAQKFPLPEVPTWSLPLLVLAIAAINGLREELVYRLVFQRTFLAAMRPAWALLLQSLAFGFLHFRNGFPQGWMGVGLTTLFGILMGMQFYLTRSIALAWLTHSFVDAAMFTIIILFR